MLQGSATAGKNVLEDPEHTSTVSVILAAYQGQYVGHRDRYRVLRFIF